MANIETYYGVDFADKVKKSLLWQYNEAENITGIVQKKEDYLFQVNEVFWCWYLFNYFYLGESTDKDGVTIWSIILNYGLSVGQREEQGTVWGFGDDDEQFDQAPFSSGNSGTVLLPLEWAIFALQLRYFQLTTSATVTQINKFMAFLFKGGGGKSIIVLDNNDMTITYRLNFTPDVNLRFIMQSLDLLPRPAGVGVNWETFTGEYWGFGDDDEQFDQAPFYEN